jgi:thiamine monophosphate synthase
MFAYKKKYFLIIQSIRDINLRNIKKYNKFTIIYRNKEIKDNINDLIKFRKKCRLRAIGFYVANNIKLGVLLKSDGIYLSSYNRTFKTLNLKNLNLKIIGSAHNVNEIALKLKQGCDYILLSKLFLVDYNNRSPFLGIVKFNKYLNTISNKLVPLGGVKLSNLNKMKLLNCETFAIMSEIKKKPTKIFSRLF